MSLNDLVGSAFDLDHEGRCTMETETTKMTMAQEKMSEGQITFEAPRPGSWMLDTTHHGRRPLTRYIQPLYLNMFAAGMPRLLERYGLPLKEFRAALVNGCFYVRPMGIGEPESSGKEPPAFVLKIVSRLHPQLRRRNQIARQAWSERRWREDVDRWFGTDRAGVVAANSALQAVEPADLDDDSLIAHLAEVTRNFSDRAVEGFETHGGDLLPVGDYLAHCRRWGDRPVGRFGPAQRLFAGVGRDGRHPGTRCRGCISRIDGTRVRRGDPGPRTRGRRGGRRMAVTTRLEAPGQRTIWTLPRSNEQPDLQLRSLLAATVIESNPTMDDADVRSTGPRC